MCHNGISFLVSMGYQSWSWGQRMKETDTDVVLWRRLSDDYFSSDKIAPRTLHHVIIRVGFTNLTSLCHSFGFHEPSITLLFLWVSRIFHHFVIHVGFTNLTSRCHSCGFYEPYITFHSCGFPEPNFTLSLVWGSRTLHHFIILVSFTNLTSLCHSCGFTGSSTVLFILKTLTNSHTDIIFQYKSA